MPDLLKKWQKGFILMELIIALGLLLFFLPTVYDFWFSHQSHLSKQTKLLQQDTEYRYFFWQLKKQILAGSQHLIQNNSLIYSTEDAKMVISLDEKKQQLKQEKLPTQVGKRKYTSLYKSPKINSFTPQLTGPLLTLKIEFNTQNKTLSINTQDPITYEP